MFFLNATEHYPFSTTNQTLHSWTAVIQATTAAIICFQIHVQIKLNALLWTLTGHFTLKVLQNVQEDKIFSKKDTTAMFFQWVWIVIYAPSCHSKSIWGVYFCGKQMDISWRMCQLLQKVCKGTKKSIIKKVHITIYSR